MPKAGCPSVLTSAAPVNGRACLLLSAGVREPVRQGPEGCGLSVTAAASDYRCTELGGQHCLLEDSHGTSSYRKEGVQGREPGCWDH